RNGGPLPGSDSREGARRGGWLGRREGASRSVAGCHVRIRARPRTTPDAPYRPAPLHRRAPALQGPRLCPDGHRFRAVITLSTAALRPAAAVETDTPTPRVSAAPPAGSPAAPAPLRQRSAAAPPPGAPMPAPAPLRTRGSLPPPAPPR